MLQISSALFASIHSMTHNHHWGQHLSHVFRTHLHEGRTATTGAQELSHAFRKPFMKDTKLALWPKGSTISFANMHMKDTQAPLGPRSSALPFANISMKNTQPLLRAYPVVTRDRMNETHSGQVICVPQIFLRTIILIHTLFILCHSFLSLAEIRILNVSVIFRRLFMDVISQERKFESNL